MENWKTQFKELFRTSWASYRAHWQPLTLTAMAPTLPVLPLILVLDLVGKWGGLLGIVFELVLSLVGVLPLLVIAGIWSQALLLVQMGEIERTGVPLPVSETWRRLDGRKTAIFWTSLMVSFAVAVGTVLFLIPGVILGWLLAATSAVLIFENERGVSAMLRSAALVRKASLHYVLVSCAFSFAGVALAIVVDLLLPTSVESWANPLANAMLMPLMTFGLAGVYFDVVARENRVPTVSVDDLTLECTGAT
jgi:hypothetical protein